nr:MAG: ORF1 [TTV-like mini virus]
MPWYHRYRYRYRPWRRRRRTWFGRPRKTFRYRRYTRRNWVRRPPFKKKLKKLKLTEYQPPSIRKCKVKGFLCLFQTTQERLSYNFDMYEESWVPDKLPGGGGFSIKNLSLYSLYQENTQGHNIFTQTNNNYPLMRYTGCKIKFYQSANVDYVATYSNTWPLKSNLAMYNTMQPSIHLMQKHKIIVPSKATQHRRKPYIIKTIKPPTQMKNQWYFQYQLSKIPLFMLRTTATTLDHYYIGDRMKSTNITIYSINTTYIQNRNWGDRRQTYYNQKYGNKTMFLYAFYTETENLNEVKINQLISLTNTQDWQEGITYEHYKTNNQTYQQYYKDTTTKGNPFYSEFIYNTRVLTMSNSPTEIAQYVGTTDTKASEPIKNLPNKDYIEIELIQQHRYNPYKDNGQGNKCYFLPVKQEGHGWDPPGRTDLENENLPLWILLFGFPDFIKKTEILHHIDTEHILVLNTTKTNPAKSPLVPISYSFTHSQSPYEENTEKPDNSDLNRWYPCYQYQQEILNTICLSGPGTPKIPPGQTVEAKIKYCFYFKWGGDLPPMSTVTDPTTQPVYPVPNNITQPTSLQNPELRPESYLYSFDERRGLLTKKATERITKDWQTKEIPLSLTAHRFSEQTETQDPQETSTSEEEEENLFELLNQQRRKQQHLKQRILTTLQKIQQLK